MVLRAFFYPRAWRTSGTEHRPKTPAGERKRERERLRGFFEWKKAATMKATASSSKLIFFKVVEYPKRVETDTWRDLANLNCGNVSLQIQLQHVMMPRDLDWLMRIAGACLRSWRRAWEICISSKTGPQELPRAAKDSADRAVDLTDWAEPSTVWTMSGSHPRGEEIPAGKEEDEDAWLGAAEGDQGLLPHCSECSRTSCKQLSWKRQPKKGRGSLASEATYPFQKISK